MSTHMSQALLSSRFNPEIRPASFLPPRGLPQNMAPIPKPGLLHPVDLFAPGAQAAQAQSYFAFVETPEVAPSLAEIKAGQVMSLPQTGESVLQVQDLLNKAGFGVEANGRFDENTQTQVRAFQKSFGIEATGKIGPTTLPILEMAAGGVSPLAKAIAASAKAIAHSRDTVGACYNAVAEAIEAHVPEFLYGNHAWMAAAQLAAHPHFREMPAPADMNQLPVGAVVVWAKGSSPSGHISVYLGQGQEASDHIAPQMQSHYGGGSARIFVPV